MNKHPIDRHSLEGYHNTGACLYVVHCYNSDYTEKRILFLAQLRPKKSRLSLNFSKFISIKLISSDCSYSSLKRILTEKCWLVRSSFRWKKFTDWNLSSWGHISSTNVAITLPINHWHIFKITASKSKWVLCLLWSGVPRKLSSFEPTFLKFFFKICSIMRNVWNLRTTSYIKYIDSAKKTHFSIFCGSNTPNIDFTRLKLI